jgi:uncharacterized Zn finger protein (UPF0148 family)
MKVCEKCGVEIATRDGESCCAPCDAKVRKSAKRRAARRERDAIMRSLGLVKVKGALGGTYWE